MHLDGAVSQFSNQRLHAVDPPIRIPYSGKKRAGVIGAFIGKHAPEILCLRNLAALEFDP